MTPDPDTLSRVQYESALRQRAANLAFIRAWPGSTEAAKEEAEAMFLDDQRTLTEEGAP